MGEKMCFDTFKSKFHRVSAVGRAVFRDGDYTKFRFLTACRRREIR